MRLRPYLRLVWRLIVVVRNWPVYWWNRFGLLQHDVVYKLRNGTQITSRRFTIDGGALNDVWLDESYEPRQFGIPFTWETCQRIIDIGANIGTFSVFAASRAPHARILAVEPEPENARYVRRNINDNAWGDRILIEEAAIGSNDGTTTLHVSHKSSGGHSRFHAYGEAHQVTVPLRSLASLMTQHGIQRCNYLKLDCEGGEYDALYSLSPEQLRTIQFMAVEYHHFSTDPRHTPTALRTYLEENGFTVHPGKKSMFFAWQQRAKP